mmetsp:Transcript_29965/g.87651  ORF Transcript_29965/g.87651 Transcript_29965/m.87651 type:complete len:397 (+) Transcript_29965:224-1414(+)
MLKQGDHCLVSFPHAFLRGISPTLDALCAALTSWDAQPIPSFHHFIVLDDVALVTAEGPLAADGSPVRIAEYSDTIVGGARRLLADGWRPRALAANMLAIAAAPATFHLLPLRAYLPSYPRLGGLLVVQRQRTAQQRRATCSAALSLVASTHQPTYNFFFANCEHAAFSVDASLPRWVSPQVPYLLWGLFRYGLQAIGVLCLWALATLPPHLATLRVLAEAGYHVFATTTLAFTIQAQCVRSAVNLTARRAELGLEAYNYLIVKEVVRACATGIVCVGGSALAPGVLRRTGRLDGACALAWLSYGVANLTFNVALQLVQALLTAVGRGVPVLMFDDQRKHARPPVAPAEGGVADARALTSAALSAGAEARRRPPPHAKPRRSSRSPPRQRAAVGAR